MIAALTLLPALLTIVGHRVDRLRIPGLGKRTPQHRRGQPLVPLEPEIQRRPVALGAALRRPAARPLHSHPVAAPRLQRRRHRPDRDDDARGLRPARRRLRTRLQRALRDRRRAAEQGRRRRPCTELSKTPAGRSWRRRGHPGRSLNQAGDTGVFQVYPTTSPQSEETTELLDHIRDDVIPPIEQQTGARVHVGGITAIFEDFGDAIADKLPLFIGVVVLLSALLLMAVFRSVLVPLKAVVMNLLSIGAAFGLIVAVFQWGWGASLIGIDGTGPIISFFPIFLFAIIFGLSMDYEVFLMSRIHEEWENSHDATAVGDPRPRRHRPGDHGGGGDHVTVFLSFMIGEDRIIKLFGLGLASAVFIDALIIRSVLVPGDRCSSSASAPGGCPTGSTGSSRASTSSPPRATRRRPGASGRRAGLAEPG